jgi:hypothetical protein
VYINDDDVKAHIGLSTNVSTKTWVQFCSKMGRELYERGMAYHGRPDQEKSAMTIIKELADAQKAKVPA